MLTSTRLGLHIAEGTDLESAFPPMNAQANGILDSAVLVTEGTLAARPAAASVEKDRIYKATDTGVWYIGDGTNWHTMLIARAWQALTLATNVIAVAGMYAPAVRFVGDKVEFRGAMQNNTGSTLTIRRGRRCRLLHTCPHRPSPLRLRPIAGTPRRQHGYC